MQRTIYLLPLLASASLACGQQASGSTNTLSAVDGQALVDRVLLSEAKAAQDTGHPMRYLLHKVSPRLATTKEIFETKDGEVARLLAMNDRPLSAADEQTELARLSGLLADPGKQRHRKQAEDQDAARALMVLHALPNAFLFQYAGSAENALGRIEKFTFRPNPNFSPPTLETQVLTKMAGEIAIDPVHERVIHLEGSLQQDVDFGWGILGRLNKGGWIAIDQADVGGGQWRIVEFQMKMSGRVVFKSRVFDTTEVESKFEPLPVGLSYQKAIEISRENTK